MKQSSLTVSEKHQLRIAEDTLRMTDAMARIMGGMTKNEAKEIIKELSICNDCKNTGGNEDG